MELFILTVKPIENKYARTLIFFAYFCNKQIPYPVFFVKAPTLRRTDEGRSKNIVLTKKSITMKRLLVLLAILLISQVGYGQQKMDQLFNAFRGESDVTSVNIGNITMKLASLFTETMGVNGIEIFEFDNCAQEVKDRLSTTIRNLRDPDYETMVTANEYTTPVICAAVEDSYDRLIAPAIEREIRNDLTEKAEDGAINVFGKNLEQLLLQPPIAGKVVLGWDPAFRTGCKLAVVDATGKVLDTKVIYPTAPQNKVEESKAELKKLIKKYNVDLISVGNGTASRESEQVIVELLKELDRPVQYVIVNEAGASVYSASKLATEEFPNFDVGQRSAASIARRLQDPLAELVKIDPKSIGVGQYQHDMNQKKLSDALSGVVEDSVNKVGVDLNTASASLLEYVSGINKTIAKNIVDYRENNGRFVSRKQLLKVPKLGPKAYEQCAGFLRIPDGKNPLDATSVHPESYEAAEQLMAKLGLTMEDIKEAQKQAAAKKASGKSGAQASGQKNGSNVANTAKKREEQKGKTVRVHNTNTAMGKALAAAMGGVSFDNSAETSTKKNAPAVQNASNDAKDISGLEKRIKNKKLLAEELGIGEITLTDILKELEKPGRDPRDDMPKPILRSDVLDMKDLKPGMILKGTVRNVIDFGVFVDIGVHQDGLVHISQITDRYIKHPLEAVSVGDIVDVQVLTVDVAKKRIGLTMKIQKQ